MPDPAPSPEPEHGQPLEQVRDRRRTAAASASVALISGLVAAVAVLRHIGTKPLWRDETVSLSVATRPVTRILSVFPHHDANAGLYYLLLHAWLWVTPGTATSIRALSAVCFIATAALGGWAATRWRDWETGLACGVLVALNPFLVYYGQEARPYALAVLLAGVSTVALFWRDGEAWDMPARRLYLVSTIAVIYADLFSVLYVGALALALLVVLRLRHQSVPPVLKRCWFTIAALTAPLAVVMLIFERGQISWLTRPNLQVLKTTITSMSAGRFGLAGVVVLGAVALIAFTRGPVAFRDQTLVVALGAALVLPPVVLWTLSQVTPTFLDRYVICSALAMVALAAAGLSVLRERAGGIVAVAVLAALVIVSGRRTAGMEAAPYKVDNAPAVVSFIRSGSRPGDAVAYAGGGLRTLVETTLGRTADFPPDVALAPGGEAFFQDDLYAREVTAPVLLDRLASVQRIWLITDPTDQAYPQGGPFAQLKSFVLTNFTAGPTSSFGSVDVTLLVRQP